MRPVKRPMSNSAVEYATLSEIIRKSLFINLFPDLTLRKTEKTKEEKDDLWSEVERLSSRADQ